MFRLHYRFRLVFAVHTKTRKTIESWLLHFFGHLFLITLFYKYYLNRSSNLSSEDATAYLERFRKEVEVVDNKLAKDRKRQEQKLHQKLTALKQKRIEEKVPCLAYAK